MDTRTKGNLGENIACEFIVRHGFVLVERNYRKKWGEIDIVATKCGSVVFFEVKSIVDHGFRMADLHRPEDNVHALKLKRLRRTVEMYLTERGRGLGADFTFHVLCVYMNSSTRRARVKWLKNVIL